jgi:GT2 family glycosyltransferase
MISICILTWARIDDSVDAVRSIYDTANVPFELLVLDQSPDNKIGKHLKELFPDIQMHYWSSNRGVAAGRNFLFSKANGDVLFAIDDDSTVGPGVVDRMHQIMLDDPKIGVLACNVIHAGRVIDPPSDPSKYEAMIFNGQSGISRAAISASGGYPEHFFRENEEKYLAMKIIDEGFNIAFVPSIVVDHKQSPIDRDLSNRLYLQSRNEIYMVIELAPCWLAVPLLAYKTISFFITGTRLKQPGSTILGVLAAFRHIFDTFKRRRPIKTKTWFKAASAKLNSRRLLP